MSPEQISLLTGVISIIEKFWGWPSGLLFVVILIGPWILSLSLNQMERRRFDAMVQMYEHNVELVKGYERISTDQQGMLILNTQEWSKTREAVEKNQFCPMVRLEKIIRPPAAG